MIENKLAGEMLSGKFVKGDNIKVKLKKGEIIFSKQITTARINESLLA
jgi:ATP-dependent Clp protease ATP-binding subunit ClpA